jgi:hypothetical protein
VVVEAGKTGLADVEVSGNVSEVVEIKVVGAGPSELV